MPHRSFSFIMSKTDQITFPPQVFGSFWINHSTIFSLSSESRSCHMLIFLFIMPLSKWIWTSVDSISSLSLPLLSCHSNSLAVVQDIILSYLIFCHRSLMDYPDSTLPLPNPPHTLLLPEWFFWSANHTVALLNSCCGMRFKLSNRSHMASYALASTSPPWDLLSLCQAPCSS